VNKKILAFLYDGERFLIVRNNPHNLAHGGGYWFTVTGSIEANESLEDAIKREIKEETNLDVLEIFDLKWRSIYYYGRKDHSEDNFLVFVKEGKVILNEEHIEFEWLRLKDFITKIDWSSNKEELKKVLEKALKKELFFKKKKTEDLRSHISQSKTT